MSDEMTVRDLIRADYHRFCDLCGAAPKGIWRVFLHPRVAPVAWMRVAGSLHRKGFRGTAAAISQINLIIFRVEIPARAQIGPGFVLPHPQGIVLGSAQIGANVTIFQNVTLGTRVFDGGYDLTKRPVIGDGVTIGAGAVVLGPVRVNSGSTVAANSLVLRDVAPDSTAIGVPAHKTFTAAVLQ
jgi:serine O-acetyltransferase